jgi:hypothetical protein
MLHTEIFRSLQPLRLDLETMYFIGHLLQSAACVSSADERGEKPVQITGARQSRRGPYHVAYIHIPR